MNVLQRAVDGAIVVETTEHVGRLVLAGTHVPLYVTRVTGGAYDGLVRATTDREKSRRNHRRACERAFGVAA